MNITELFASRQVLSFEIFPPKRTSPIETVYRTLDDLQGLHPDFISVTYGAGGSAAGASTCEIAATIREKYAIPPIAHLPCIHYTKAEILAILEDFRAHGVHHVLALRGDRNPDIPPKEDFAYAAELVAFLKEQGDFTISGACYPEGHIESPDLVTDIRYLKEKVDAGVSHLMSQLFFDNRVFYDFWERTKIAGITVPIEAGIMPVVNKKQIERMVSMCGASLPAKFTKMMQRYENNPEALRDAGIAYAIDQIVDLVANGVDGIHLYTMNNALVARRITEAVERLIHV